jgi:integrase-like protein/Arm domain-containing DNA-binding protein
MRDRKAHEMGLGSVGMVTLADAREKARQARQQLFEGVDPLAQKRGTIATRKAAAAAMVTFREAATRYVETNKSGWTKGHAKQWSVSLRQYVFPIIGDVGVDLIDTPHVVNVLLPIWDTVPEVANRVRNRIENVLDYAHTLQWRPQAENCARWKGHLENVLPRRSKSGRSGTIRRCRGGRWAHSWRTWRSRVAWLRSPCAS